MKKREYVHDIDVQRRVGELLTDTTAVITTITILDDRGGSGMWLVMHETEPTDREIEMTQLWGERKDEFDGAFIACHAWKHFDETGEIAK
jgi:hypothetical protein